MFIAGLDVVRLNFSHGSGKQHLDNIKLVRRLNKKYRRHIRIMQDLEGFRIRVGRFKGPKTRLLESRTIVWLTTDPAGAGPRTIPFDYQGNLKWIKPKQLIYIDDGNLILRVESSSTSSIKAKVVEGGVLKERKGINIPGVDLGFKSITEKDEKDIEFGVKAGVDYVALSFVRNANDVLEAAALIKPRLPKCQIVAKIENRPAIENIDAIIKAADGIMVARGDMGISVPIHQVPMIQKRIISKCNAVNKFVITATQMLEHMTEHSRPTRAEVTDVANAVIDGTDYVMLSAETAVGKYPYESVHMMNEIIKFTEQAKPHLQ
jgi:pyruvate kinase